MATKICFIVNESKVFEEKVIKFNYIKGMAFSQKQKNVLSFHSSIKEIYPNHKILEVSTKSQDEIGALLSAFNLKLDGYCFESLFQASKVFVNGEQYEFLKTYPPIEAKKFIRNQDFNILRGFKYKDEVFPLNPKSFFYDYLYIKALQQIPNISKQVINYDIFTDIEFNEKKQFNCQARACAIYSYMLRTNTVEHYMSSLNNFKKIYTDTEDGGQLSFF